MNYAAAGRVIGRRSRSARVAGSLTRVAVPSAIAALHSMINTAAPSRNASVRRSAPLTKKIVQSGRPKMP